MKSWIKVTSLDKIPAMGARKVLIDDLEIGVFKNAKEEVFALENKCPHKEGVLTEGMIHHNTVTCPLHNWDIDLKTGEAKDEDCDCVIRYEIKVEDNIVYLNI